MELSVPETLKLLLADMKKMTREIKTLKEDVKDIKSDVDVIHQLRSEKKENDKDRINKAFEKKQIGRPVGSWEDKRKQYFEWITSGKITQPKEDTLAYYKINRDPTNNSYVLLT
jgi:hypothetical protein